MYSESVELECRVWTACDPSLLPQEQSPGCSMDSINSQLHNPTPYRTFWHCPVHLGTVQCIWALYSTFGHCTVHLGTVQDSLPLYSTFGQCTVHLGTVQYIWALYSTFRHRPMLWRTVLYCTVVHLYSSKVSCTVDRDKLVKGVQINHARHNF